MSDYDKDREDMLNKIKANVASIQLALRVQAALLIALVLILVFRFYS